MREPIPQNKSKLEQSIKYKAVGSGFLDMEIERNIFEDENNGDLHRATLRCDQGFQNIVRTDDTLSFEIIGNLELNDFLAITDARRSPNEA